MFTLSQCYTTMGYQYTAFIIVFCLITCDSKSYRNFTLFLGIPTTEHELEFYKTMDIEYDIVFWIEPCALFKAVEFMVDPEKLEVFTMNAKENNISLSLIMRDVQSAFDKQTVTPYIKTRTDSFGWYSYHGLDAIYDWLADLERANPTILKMEEIGLTTQNRSIYVVKLKHLHDKKLPKVVIEGGVHAREWISMAFVTFLINELVTASQTDNEDLKTMAMAYEWLIVPVLNPDGYEYSHTANRLWRKNRHSGHGVDINRNFGHMFGIVGVSKKKTADNYPGENEFSEPETRALVHLVATNKEDLRYYLAFHSFGQYIIIPYSFTAEHLDNYDEVKYMATQVKERIRRSGGTEYTIGTSSETLGYKASGSSTGWAKNKYNIPYVVAIELRDTGLFGFALPPEQILPTCLETLAGLHSFLDPRTAAAANDSERHPFMKPSGAPNIRQLSMLSVIIVFTSFCLRSE